jgi:hypothetical protein
VKVPELDYPEPESSIAYILNHFYALKQATGERISYTELKSYSQVMAYNLAAWECDLIMQIDRIFEASLNG